MSEATANPATRATRSRRWIWACAAIAIAAIGIAAISLTRSTVKSAKLAREAVAARKFEEARAPLQDWLKADPNSGEAHYLLARVELAANHGQEVMNALGKALDLGYPPDKLAPYRAVMLVNTNRFDEAEPLLHKALADSDERMPEIAKALAKIYLTTFRLKEASGPLARWMRDDPDDPTPYLWQNEVESRSDADKSVVVTNYREALRRDPSLAKARFGLADTLRQQHHLDEAAEEFATYIQANPNSPEGHFGAGSVAYEQGKFDDAAKHFDRVVELNPKDAAALKQRGAIELRHGRLEAARDFLKHAAEADPFDPDTHYQLMQVYQRLGDTEGVKRHKPLFEKLRDDHARMNTLKSQLVKKPKDLKLRAEIAQWLLEHGHEDEGVQLSEQILREAPNNEPTIRAMLDHFTRKASPGKINYYRLLLKEATKGSP